MTTPPGVLVTLLADEMRETLVLVGVLDAARPKRSGWKRAFFAFLPSGQDVAAVQAVQYLDDNLERARDHWAEVSALLVQLRDVAADDGVAALLRRLDEVDVGGVEAALRPDIVPRPVKEVVPHLRIVAGRIRECLQAVTDSQRQAVLQAIREGSGGARSGSAQPGARRIGGATPLT